MVTAVDTNVLLDVLGADKSFGLLSKAALQDCLDEGGLIACDVVWAEVSAWFPEPTKANETLGLLGIRYVPIDEDSAAQAGQAWRRYRRSGGDRQRIVADFLIGSHAASRADRLLTRDRGFYRKYFDFEIVDPGGGKKG